MADWKGMPQWASWGAAVVLVASLATAGWAYVRDHSHEAAVEHERAVIFTAERLLSALKDVETGVRGFVITGQETYLEPYESGRLAALPAQEQLGNLLGNSIGKLRDLVTARQAEADHVVATTRQGGVVAGVAAIDRGTGKAAMDAVRAEVAGLQQEADRRIATTRRAQAVDDGIRLASVVGLVASSALLGLTAVLRRREQQASQRLFEGVLENAPIGLGILDPTLRLRHLNPALAKMSERALGAQPGMSLWEVVPQMRGALEPRLARVLRGNRVANADVEAASNVAGEPARSYQATFYPLRNGHSAAGAGVGMVIVDVTARKRAEQATRASEERFRSLVQASAAMIWTADRTGAFATPQPSWTRFTGQPEAASLGWGRFACLHPDDVELTRQAWATAAGHASPIAIEHRVRRADGEWRHMALSVAPVLEDDGTVREWVGSHTDITARKQAELALAAAKDAAEGANRAKSVFLANMSHELRTPLSAVIGYSEMLEEEAEERGDSSMLADLGKIQSNAKHLLSLINDVLDLSKVEANRMNVVVEDVEVRAFVTDTAGTVASLVQRRRNTLTLDVPNELGSMRTDLIKLRQILFNLLGNAAKFTEAGTITLSVRRERGVDGDWLSFAVRDTGIGMTPAQVGQLFQRFTQADETTTRKFGGTGLGLALSRAFAQLLGGDIAVESEDGRGSCFTLRVPAVAQAVEAASGAEPLVTGEAASEAGNLVVVIDDEAAQRDLTARYLRRQGFSVRAAADGPTGLALARELQPRAILLDVMMPNMDGWEVLKALKTDPLTSDIPVVMVSFAADAGMSASLGAAHAVPKPVDWARLREVMAPFNAGGGDVLVVDDDADLRARLRVTLEKSGWTVGEAGDGAEALELVRQSPPRIILLDLTMPVLDGFAFLRRLREMPGCADIPVVVLSARDVTRSEEQRLTTADRVLRKGETSMQTLRAELRRLDDKRLQAS